MTKLELTNSERKCHGECQRKWYYGYELCRIPSRSREPLYFGSAMGLGFDDIWEEKVDILSSFKAEIEKKAHPEKRQLLMTKGEAMLSAYRQIHDPDEWELIQTEKPVKMEIDGYPITYRGKLDKVARNKKDGVIYLIDHKTSIDEIENPIADFWLNLMIDNQPTGYQIALEQQLDEEVRILWDVVKKHSSLGPKQKKPYVKKRKSETDAECALRKADNLESWNEYADRLYKDYTEKPNEYFKRRQIGRTSEDKALWKDELIADAAAMANSRVIGVFPRRSSSCRKWGSICEYASVCSGLESIESDNFVTKENRHPELDGEEIKEELNVTV